MGFLNNLFKGFIRSTVNQVGRDSGRVISNTVYKDKHSIPIRIVKDGNNEKTTKTEYIENANQINIPEGYEYNFFSSKRYIYFFMLIGAFILYPISWLYFLINGIIYYNKKTITYSGYETQSVYKADKRYKTEKRYEGKRNVKANIEFQATERELKLNKTKGLYYLLIFFVMYVVPMIIIYFTEYKNN